jgi:hypothetical protein
MLQYSDNREAGRIEELRRTSEIADAQLGVAEEFAWPVAALSAALAYVTRNHWAWAVLAFVAGFLVSVYPLRRASDKAEDAYFKAACLGKYMERRHDPEQ